MSLLPNPSCCSHCNRDYSPQVFDKELVDGRAYYFCCNGCKLVFLLLKEERLESFYDKLGGECLNTRQLQDKPNKVDYTSPNFQSKYLRQRGEFLETCFIIDGLVCAACVWLNEKILRRLPGIIEVALNYTTHKTRILFDPNLVSLQEIVKSIEGIGYKVTFYTASSSPRPDSGEYIRLVVALFCTMNIMWVNVGQYSGHFLGMDETSRNIMNLASFILAAPTLFFCADGFYKRAYKGLLNGVVSMDLLVVTGTSLVYIYSTYAWLSHNGHTYFESVCMIVLFVLGAKFAESLSRRRALDNLDRLSGLLPLEARLEDGTLVPVHNVNKKDRLLVLPGEMVACDGILLSEQATLDCKNISGESAEVYKKIGDSISSGSLVLYTPVIYEAREEFSNSSMSKLARLLEESSLERSRLTTLALRVASYFSPTVLALAFFSFLYHFFLGSGGFEHSLLIAVSVIIIACPCALALATPLASVVGLNRGFKNNVVFTKGTFLEALASSNSVVFDKTGTLTEGKLKLVGVERLGWLDSELYMGRCLESKIIPGRGIEAIYEDCEILGGSQCFFEERGLLEVGIEPLSQSSPGVQIAISQSEKNGLKDLLSRNPHPIATALLEALANPRQEFCAPKENLKHGATRFYLAFKPRGAATYSLAYVFYFHDSLKDGARALMDSLKSQGKRLFILSGDREGAVSYMASQLGIESFYANQTPEEKAYKVEELKASGGVVMVGDGLNDSLALKYATVGISLAGGSEVAISHSEVVILDSRLSTLGAAFMLSNTTLKRIKQNLCISLAYNALALPLALCGLVLPLFAAGFMALSSVTVVLNSLRE